jgi:hypothetical protein
MFYPTGMISVEQIGQFAALGKWEAKYGLVARPQQRFWVICYHIYGPGIGCMLR